MTTEEPSALTIKTFQAYLDPLLKKHESRKVIVYEDLLASWEAAEAVLAENRSSPDVSIVKEKIKTVHDEQLLEYEKAGKQAITEYGRNCPLLIGDSSDHPSKCIRQAVTGAPAWKLPRSKVLSILQKVIQERLNSAPLKSPPLPNKAPPIQTPALTKPLFKKNEPVEMLTTVAEEGEDDEGHVEEGGNDLAPVDDGEVEEGEEMEDGEEADEPAEDGDNAGKSDIKGNRNTKGLLAKKKALGKTAPTRKKASTVKGGRTAIRGRPARRGGRGGKV